MKKMKNYSFSLHHGIQLVAISAMMLVAGCGKKSVTPDVEIRTVAYYIEHEAEREKTLKGCVEFRDGSYTAMNAEDREIADKSDWMMNCSNAGEGHLGAYHKRQREAAAKYGQ
jgi:major membrane immunogen (membrane-anchored lipoprotein)